MANSPLHVGLSGSYIDNNVMDRVLRSDVIGASPYLCVWGVSESTAFMFIDQASTSQDPEFVRLNPLVRTLVLPVCLGFADDAGEWQGGHFVTLKVNVRAKIVDVFDSLFGNASMLQVAAHARTLTNNIWGTRSATCTVVRARSDTQTAGSNDCGVFTFRNVCTIASSSHVLPFLGGIPMVSFDFIDREVFRRIVKRL